ncbi:GH36 C-terminal domain-containing protein [uncultured Clostridium sp.]|uniref:GH36 C-terminal domain-containing protein n=1 Tax=Clostridium disporicum TaxID=84024 RepID=UPI0025E6D8C1|nr:GH36 C-terminal domain-containing protein [uncultured Clostridium sp.]MDU4325375.1 GH36 C-terminal domain-containing protein [Clostridium celatum]
MGISIIENNNIFDMIYMNINEGASNNESARRNPGNVTSNFVKDVKYFKLNNLSRNANVECFEAVSKDKNEVLLTFNGLSLENINNLKRLKLKGLIEDAIYMSLQTNEVFSGGALMNYGVNIKKLFQTHVSNQIHLKMI